MVEFSGVWSSGGRIPMKNGSLPAPMARNGLVSSLVPFRGRHQAEIMEPRRENIPARSHKAR